jgi:hypothetical protein
VLLPALLDQLSRNELFARIISDVMACGVGQLVVACCECCP